MKLIFATGNKGKIREAAEILGSRFELASPVQFGITEDIPETGQSLLENSLQKADYVYERTGMNCFADDTGLEVEALGGAPGVYSARYAGPGHDNAANIQKLLSELSGCGSGVSRKARFRTVVTLIVDGEKHFFEGVLEGSIALSKAGCGGFGYDPVFVPDESELVKAALDLPADGRMTLAELPEEAKNAISHRGKAVRAMAEWLKAEA